MHIGIVGPVSTKQLEPSLHKLTGFEPSGLGGVPVNNLILELAKQAKQISVFSLSPDLQSSNSPVIIRGEYVTLYYGSYRARARERMKDLFSIERNFLLKTILQISPDILHAHWQYEWGWAALNSKIPTLLTCHDSPLHVLKAQKDLYRLGRLLMAAYVLPRAKNITAVSEHTAKGLRFLTNRVVKVIPNFEPSCVFKLYSEKQRGQSAKIVMVNNGFSALKNTSTALRAFGMLRAKHPEATLHLYGSDYGPNEIAEKWAKDQGLGQNVYFHGFIEFNQLISELKDMDIFLHTAIEESCPMVLIEASALGLPIIAGKNSGGVPWLLDYGRAGLLVDIRSPSSVTQALSHLMDDEDIFNRLSLAGRKNAEVRFSPDIVLNQYREEYRRILSNYHE